MDRADAHGPPAAVRPTPCTEGLSLRAYLARLAETMLTPAERAERAEQAQAALRAWNGYAPTAAEQHALDDELDRRLAAVQRP
ncbi:hypothetical protein ACFWBI_37195 [Streptomyces sp. NPDC059982]|uniref:hypothetical protein n=1 Tax=unclassified Streptomyces TaxID=2593676 RepID=UPI00369FF9B6